MYWILYVVIGLVGLFGLVLVWGFFHLVLSRRLAQAEIRKVELSEIELLAQECIEVFEKKLKVKLDLNDCEDAAQKLDNAFRNTFQLKEAFAHRDFYWYFVKPMGACLGETETTIAPFGKIIKQHDLGDPGDIAAYVALARSIKSVTEQRQL